MSRYIGALTLVVALLWAIPSGKSEFLDYHPIAFRPVAEPGRLSSLYYNPAGLGFLRGANFSYTHSHQPELFSRDKSFTAGIGQLAFGVEDLGQGLPFDYRKFSIGLAENYRQMISCGVAYRWARYSGVGPGKFHQWDAGVIVRPWKFLSIGFYGQNLNNPITALGAVVPKYTGGLSVRPFGNRLTLSGQLAFRDGDDLDAASNTMGLEIQPIDGMTLGFEVNDHRQYGFAVRLNSLFAGSSGYNRITKDGETLERVTEVEINSSARAGFRPYSRGFLKIVIDSDIVEENRRRGKLFDKNHSLLDILQLIDRAANDKDIAGILLEIRGMGLGMASVQELRNQLIDFRGKGKLVVAYGVGLSGREYYLATAADKIFMMPTGYLDLSGMRAEVTFYKGLLDKLGIEAEIVATGEYKSAGEIVTRKGMSDAFREQVNELLDEMYGQMTIDMANAREMPVSEMVFTIDRGPFTTSEAISGKLIDGLLYQHQIEDELRRLTAKRVKILGAEYYTETLPKRESWGSVPAIAVVYATGLITAGKSSSGGLFEGMVCGGETVAGAMKKAADDSRVKAVVLRVDSQGGDMAGSDKILSELKKTQRGKPVIVSMGDVAASGGYHISCWGDKVFADNTSITGSIGVISGKPVVKGLYDKLGLNKEIITRGKNADMFSLYTKPTEEQRDKATEQVWQYYRAFLETVAMGRGMEVEKVDSIGRGRVWAGSKAVENGLVDEIGGLMESLDAAKEAAGIKGDYDLVILPDYPGWFSPQDIFGPSLAKVFGRLQIEDLQEIMLTEGILYLMPYHLEIK